MSGGRSTRSEGYLQLEAAALVSGDFRNAPNKAIQLSTAISLKRIADCLEATVDHSFNQPAFRSRS